MSDQKPPRPPPESGDGKSPDFEPVSITDLMASEEAARRSQTDYWEAVYRYHTGYANLELASGTLNPQSPVVTP